MSTEYGINFGTSSKFGEISGWIPQDASPSHSEQLARVLDATGNGLVSGQQLYDGKTDVSQNFTAASPSTVLPSLKIGGLRGGVNVVTSIAINTTWNDFAKIALTGHNHDENSHGNGLAQADISAVGLPALFSGFGATCFSGADWDDAQLQNSSLTIACQHVDHNTPEGDHAVGENYDCVATFSETWQGEPIEFADSTWKITNISRTESNTDFETVTVTGQKPITLVIP